MRGRWLRGRGWGEGKAGTGGGEAPGEPPEGWTCGAKRSWHLLSGGISARRASGRGEHAPRGINGLVGESTCCGGISWRKGALLKGAAAEGRGDKLGRAPADGGGAWGDAVLGSIH